VINAEIQSLAEITYSLMKSRLMEYDSFSLAEIVKGSGEVNTFVEFLTPLKLLKRIGKEYFYELLARFEDDMQSSFPWDVLFKDPALIEKY
jgi:hypothetical protein